MSAAAGGVSSGARVAVEANKPGLSAGFATPSDSTGAIGPNHYIETINAAVGLFDRNLQPLSAIDLGVFIGALGTNFPSDPQIQWDQQGGRWLYAALEISGTPSGPNSLHFGWSKSGDPAGLTLSSSDWCSFSLPPTGEVDDFPKLGHDANFILIGDNVIASNAPNGRFVTARVWAIPKPAVGDSTCPTVPPIASQFGSAISPLRYSPMGDEVFTPVPANVADASSTAYIVSLDLFSSRSMGVFHVDPGSGCTVTSAPCLVTDGIIAVNPWPFPPAGRDWTVPQPGGAPALDALFGQLTQAVQVAGPTGAEAVWTQHTNGVSSDPAARTVVTWYELTPTLCVGGTCPPAAKHQEGTIGDPTLSAFNAAISPDSRNENTVITYDIGGASSLVAVATEDRNFSEPLNVTFRAQTLATSPGPENDFTCTAPLAPVCRWGDYAGSSPDPVVKDAVWGTNMLVGAPRGGVLPMWTTQNFSARRWEPVPLTLAAATGPDAASWGPGRLDVFGEGTAGDLQHVWAAGAGPGRAAWSGPESLGGVLTAEPGAVSWGLGRIDVFGRGTDGQLWHRWFDGVQWLGWEPLGGVLQTASGPDVASWAPGRLDVFVRGTDDQLWHKWFDGVQWNGWEPLGGVLTSAPAAVSWGPNRIDVFVRGTTFQLYHKWFDGVQWNGWELLAGGAVIGSEPDAASCAPGQLEVLALNPSNTVVRQTYSGGWSSVGLVGGSAATGGPSAVCRAGLGLNVFTEASDGSVARASIS